jgi:hypothetical protein
MSGSPTGSTRDRLRPWEFVVVRSDHFGSASYGCMPWSSTREPAPLMSPMGASCGRVKTIREGGSISSPVWGCKHSPVRVSYGKARSPVNYRRPSSAPAARAIDCSLPASCYSPLPVRIDAAVGGVTHPTRVPYGLVATHKKLLRAASTAASSPTAALQSGAVSPMYYQAQHQKTRNAHEEIGDKFQRGGLQTQAERKDAIGSPSKTTRQSLQAGHGGARESTEGPRNRNSIWRDRLSVSEPSLVAGIREYHMWHRSGEPYERGHSMHSLFSNHEPAHSDVWLEAGSAGQEIASKRGKGQLVVRRPESPLDVRCRWMGIKGPRYALETKPLMFARKGRRAAYDSRGDDSGS